MTGVVIWAEKDLPAPCEQAHMFVIHNVCGARTSSADTCTACGERLTAGNTSWHSLTRTADPVPLASARAQTPVPGRPTSQPQNGTAA